MIEAVPSLSLDTSALPAHEQFAHWAAHSPHTVLAPIRPGPFLARGTLWHSGSLCLSHTILDPFTSVRTPELVRATAADFIQLVVLRDGLVRLETGGIERRCAAPDLFVRDYARPSVATAEQRLDVLVVYFARPFLEQATGPFAFEGPLPWSSEAALLGRTVRLVAESLPGSAATSAEAYARVLRDLLAAVVRRDERALLASGSAQLHTRERVKARIAAAPPGSITVDGLTAALGLSRSTLFGLFRAHGGVMAYDRLRRLRALYRDLENAGETASVAELGARYGFLDKAVLSRSFRRAFGRSPQEVRNGVGARPPTDPLGARVRRAIEQAAG